MDLSSPRLLAREIRTIVTRITRDLGMDVDPSAFDVLTEPAMDWGYTRLRNVDRYKLRRALIAVLMEIPETSPPSPIDAEAIRFAMKRSSCHYLWFC